jgi:hypothetical protein
MSYSKPVCSTRILDVEVEATEEDEVSLGPFAEGAPEIAVLLQEPEIVAGVVGGRHSDHLEIRIAVDQLGGVALEFALHVETAQTGIVVALLAQDEERSEGDRTATRQIHACPDGQLERNLDDPGLRRNPQEAPGSEPGNRQKTPCLHLRTPLGGAGSGGVCAAGGVVAGLFGFPAKNSKKRAWLRFRSGLAGSSSVAFS